MKVLLLAVMIELAFLPYLKAWDINVKVDAQDSGRAFEGIGAVSAGASSRLLYDYTDPIRSDILNYLFKPNFGAGFQHLKVEIGGGENSTCGSEPSHAITRDELRSPVERGYELWLMNEARNRNPHILLDALPWSYPEWIKTGGGRYSQDSSDWIIAFLDLAKSKYQLKLDWLAAAQNESNVDRNWIVTNLRPALNSHGYQEVKLQAPDSNKKYWEIFNDFRSDADYSSAVQAVGFHYVNGRNPWIVDEPGHPATDLAKAGPQSLWDSEEWSNSGKLWGQDPGALYLARVLNKMYIRDRITKTEIWCPIASILPGLPYADTGAMEANSPWSGHYSVWPAIWAVAHTTQFAQLGWHYLDGSCGQIDPATWKGSYVTLKDPGTNNWSMIICTDGDTNLKVTLVGNLNTGTVHVWKSNEQQQFIEDPSVMPDGNHEFQVALKANSVYSLTTTTGQQKGQAANLIPELTSFPFPYTDDFEKDPVGSTPHYFMDQKGTFEVADDPGHGKCLKQILPGEGKKWGGKLPLPCSVIGDVNWTDYSVKTDVRIVGGKVGIGGRFSSEDKSGYSWYELNVDRNGQWSLDFDTNSKKAALASGQIANFIPDGWHVLELDMKSSMIQATIDSQKLAESTNSSKAAGLAYLSSTYDPNLFDNFVISH